MICIPFINFSGKVYTKESVIGGFLNALRLLLRFPYQSLQHDHDKRIGHYKSWIKINEGIHVPTRPGYIPTYNKLQGF